MTAVSPDTQAAFEGLLGLREGRRNVVYLDSRGRPTGGIGHLIRPEDKLAVGDAIPEATIDAWFAADTRDAMARAVVLARQAGITDDAFLPYLASVCFQLGDGWTLFNEGRGFPRTWALIVAGNYAEAATDFRYSDWDKETPVRVKDFQGALMRLPAKA